MEDTPEMARAMICPLTQSNLYGFDGNETRSLSTIALPVCTDLYVITEFFVIDVASPHNAILGRLWIHMMKVVHAGIINSCGIPLRWEPWIYEGTKPCREFAAIAQKRFFREETEATRRTIAITERWGPNDKLLR